VVRLLGKGGMGSVYLGEHVHIGKRVAIKFLRSEYASQPGLVERFHREARAAAAINHKGIIDILDVGLSNRGEPYLVMEYLEGESLSNLLKRLGPMDLATACGVLEPVLLALSAVHDKGIIHRDIKPDNIFIAKGGGGEPLVKLIDFGISRFTQTGESRLTQTGEVFGTPEYMAPEQARGKVDIDARVDLYAVGVILYEMLTGALPYTGANYNDLIINILTLAPRPPSQVCPTFPKEAEELVMQALAKDPQQRFQSAMAFLAALKQTESFYRRQEQLTQLVTRITSNSCASGHLGKHVSSGVQAAEKLFGRVPSKGTPNGWTETKATRAQNRRALVAGAAAVIVAGAIGATVWVAGNRTAMPAAVVPVAAPIEEASAPLQTDRVKVEIRGAPQGAVIYCDDRREQDNPFRVKRGDAIVTVRIESPGYRAFQAAVQPNQDRVVQVEMQREVAQPEVEPALPPVVEQSKTSREDQAAQSKRTKKTRKQSESPGSDRKGKIGESGRGTKFVDQFE
jgi:serine/threonine protein kinase